MVAMRSLAVALALGFACVASAHAGRSCEAAKPSAQVIERGLQLAQRTMTALEDAHVKNGTRAVLLARAGQDLTRYGLRYSHMGFAYRTVDGQGQAAWRVVHKLNHCGTAEAAVYRQGLGEFFLDDLWRYEAAYAVPAPHVQDKLVALLADDRRATALQHRPYSIVSYAWGGLYQQSNQWVTETLALAMDASVENRQQAQAWLQGQSYQPTALKLGALTRLGGRVSAANVAFNDHPPGKRFADRIETVTADSVFAWLQRSGLAAGPQPLRE